LNIISWNQKGDQIDPYYTHNLDFIKTIDCDVKFSMFHSKLNVLIAMNKDFYMLTKKNKLQPKLCY